MDGPAKKTDVFAQNIRSLLSARDINADLCPTVRRNVQFSQSLLKRLGLDAELKGHNGCVNCLEWTEDGMRLASGSDDTTVIIWDPFTHRQLEKITTTHTGNIFSIKFVSSNAFLATGAGDYRVLVQPLNRPHEKIAFMDCRCHVSRVKRLATVPDEPSVFWSAGEDGFVMQYDLRVAHDCQTRNQLYIDLHRLIDFKCIALNPMKTHLIALGANDCLIRVFDRRKIDKLAKEDVGDVGNQKDDVSSRRYEGCVEYYSPAHLARDFTSENNLKLATTYVSFDSTGSYMLANIGGENIYLFDSYNPKSVSELRVPETVTKDQQSTLTEKDCCQENRQYQIDDYRTNLSEYDRKIANGPCACDYVRRGQRLLHRKWPGDSYTAVRDFLIVIQHCPHIRDAYLGLVQALMQLNWLEEAFIWLEYFKDCFKGIGDTLEFKEMYNDLKEDLHKRNTRPEPVFACSDEDKRSRRTAHDFESRFVGHCNTTTDIKEANFFGQNSDFICAGSDDGVIFMWDRRTTNIISALHGDSSIVNCVQPHPNVCLLATSGIDTGVKLWSPGGEGADEEEDPEKSRKITSIWAAVEMNQQRMAMDPFETMIANMGYRISPVGVQNVSTCRAS